MRRVFGRSVAAMLVVACTSGVVSAQTNLLTNGDFEADAEGTVAGGTAVGDVGTITGWRVFAVNGATGFATVSSAAGRTGKGIELTRQAAPGSDSAIDKDESSVVESIPTQERIYKMTIDARDGGTYGGSNRLFTELQFPGSTGRGANYDPGADWETFGMTARSGVEGRLSARFNLPSEFNSSLYLDNARVVDATAGVNRMVNGGFENSSTRLLNWRFFDTTGASGSATLSNDAHSGSSAARLDVTADVAIGDVGLDLEGNRIAAIGGESLQLSFAAKTADATNPSARLRVTVAGFDSGGNFVSDIVNDMTAPPSDAYEEFAFDFQVPESVSFLNVAFRSIDEFLGFRAQGSFLIDSVTVSRPLDIGAVDLDGNMVVDGNDFLLIQRGYGTTTSADTIDAWKSLYGTNLAQVAAVPEPATVGLAAMGLLLAGGLRRLRR